jgi:outer membrane protein insertion porin family
LELHTFAYRKTQSFIALFCCIIISSCNYTKRLTDNQTLLKENKITLKLPRPIKYKGELISTIATLTNPQPNAHMLDLGLLPKYKLWRYNSRYNYFKKHDDDVKITKRKVEKPVLIDSAMIARSNVQIKQFMANQGYFYASVTSEVLPVKHKIASILYYINAGKSYFTNEINYDVNSADIKSILIANSKESFLQKGIIFTNYACGLERERIYKILKNEGYYDFKTDNITFTLDTTNKQKLKNLLIDPFEQMADFDSNPKFVVNQDSLNVLVTISQSKDSTFDVKYLIDSIQVYLLDNHANYSTSSTIIKNELDDIQFIYKALPINRKVITRNIFFSPGDVYNTKSVEATTNRLNQLNVFQFVNVQFTKSEETIGKLNCKIMLNTMPKMDFIGSTELSNSDDYYFGFGASITYRNKNLFHGANQLMIRLSPSVEFRNDDKLSGSKRFYNSGLNVNLSSSITFPKFIVPFNQNIFNKKNKPFTALGLNYSYLRRLKSYTLINVSSLFSYTWRETEQKNWKFTPAFLTLTFLPSKQLDPDFKQRIEGNKYLKNTYESNVIQGENVNFEYQSKTHGTYKSFSIFKINVEEAGTIMKGINGLYFSLLKREIEPIAHYLRTEIDARTYTNSRKTQWVNRMMIGVGIPFYGNSALPYSKQFSAGGPFSMRGWQVRTLGPGRSYDSSFTTSSNNLLDKTGDLKFEANTEYRFNLVKLFSGAIDVKGAAFMDVGNIWLLRKNNDVKGGEIDLKYLFHDLAIGAGAGLRFDFSFLVLRTDLGFPIKRPEKPEQYGFAFNELKWKKGIWSINFGYPF